MRDSETLLWLLDTLFRFGKGRLGTVREPPSPAAGRSSDGGRSGSGGGGTGLRLGAGMVLVQLDLGGGGSGTPGGGSGLPRPIG